MTEYQFINDWFGTTADKKVWEQVFSQLKPKNCLEIGSYEGRSAVFTIEHLGAGQALTCVDTWAGSADLDAAAMLGVEERFDANILLARSRSPCGFTKIKQPSSIAMAKMLHDGLRFDFIYIDGSHTAPDVLTDAVMAYRLLNPGGVMIFDDYFWRDPGGDILMSPALAIDLFANVFSRSMATFAIGGQRALQRTR